MNVRSLIITMVVASAVAAPVHAQRFMSSGVPDRQVIAFFDKLHAAAVRNDRAAIVKMVNYPLMVNRGGTVHQKIATEGELLRRYDEVFNPAIRQAIVLEKSDRLIGSQDGVALAKGTIWLRGACDRARPPVCKLGLGSVNLPELKKP
jgi:hypothetical protein